MFKQRLQSFEDLHLAGDSRWRRGLSLHYRHPQTALMTGHQTLQVLQQQLQHTTKENIHLKLRPSVCFYQRDPHQHTLVLFLSAFSSDISSSFSSSCSRHMFSSFVRVANSYTANRHTAPRLIWHHIFTMGATLGKVRTTGLSGGLRQKHPAGKDQSTVRTRIMTGKNT